MFSYECTHSLSSYVCAPSLRSYVCVCLLLSCVYPSSLSYMYLTHCSAMCIPPHTSAVCTPHCSAVVMYLLIAQLCMCPSLLSFVCTHSLISFVCTHSLISCVDPLIARLCVYPHPDPPYMSYLSKERSILSFADEDVSEDIQSRMAAKLLATQKPWRFTPGKTAMTLLQPSFLALLWPTWTRHSEFHCLLINC